MSYFLVCFPLVLEFPLSLAIARGQAEVDNPQTLINDLNLLYPQMNSKSLHFQSGFLIHSACILCIGELFRHNSRSFCESILNLPSYYWYLLLVSISAIRVPYVCSKVFYKIKKLVCFFWLLLCPSVHQVCLLANLIISDGFIY